MKRARPQSALRRQWDMFFHLSVSVRSVCVEELMKLFKGRWSRKTILRDLIVLEDYGVHRVGNDGVWYYRYMGSVGPFIHRSGEKWCCSCRQFRKLANFGLLRTSPDGLMFQCLDCKRAILRRYYNRNRKFVLKRERRYYKSRVKLEVMRELGLQRQAP